MSARCRALGCTAEVPDFRLMCARHWALLPDQVKWAWGRALRDHRESPNGRVLLDNLAEVQRILADIEARASLEPGA